MNIIRRTSPYLRNQTSRVNRMMFDVIIALMPVTLFAIYQFGINALVILLTSVITMVITEYVFNWLSDKINDKKTGIINESFTLGNGTAIISGLIFGLTLPDNTPLFVVIVGGVLGMFLAKLVFGGLGNNIFNVAAVSRVIVVISYAGLIGYEKNTVDVDGSTGATALGIIQKTPFNKDVLNSFSNMDLFTGMGIPGCLGEVSALMILIGFLYLAFRRSLDIRIPIVYVGTVFILALVSALTLGVGMWFPLFSVLSGGLLFGAVFMATDPVTSPITGPARIYYAFALGVLTYFIRIFGAYPEGVVFSIIIMNTFVPSFDYYKFSNSRFTKRSVIIFSIVIITVIVITALWTSSIGVG